MSEIADAILSLEHLGVSLPRGADRPHALSDVSLAIASDEILCVVGESGSGKSMMANAIMRLLPNDVTIDGGRVMFEGRDLAAATVAEMRKVRGAGIAMIFQEPMTALNPLRTIGDQIARDVFDPHKTDEIRDHRPKCWRCSRTSASPTQKLPQKPIRMNYPAANASAP